MEENKHYRAGVLRASHGRTLENEAGEATHAQSWEKEILKSLNEQSCYLGIIILSEGLAIRGF